MRQHFGSHNQRVFTDSHQGHGTFQGQRQYIEVGYSGRHISTTRILPCDRVVHQYVLYFDSRLFLPLSCLSAFLIPAQAVDDDEISCEIPNELPDGSRSGIDMAVAAIEHARICAKISKQLLSTRASNQSPEALFNIMETLEKKLQRWRNSLPDHLILPKQNDSLPLRNFYKCRTDILRLHYLYWGSVIALNANFHYPWISSLLTRSEPFFEDRMLKSSIRTAEASREILSSLKDTELDTSFSSP